MYHDHKGAIYYHEGDKVMCPLTRKPCLLTCPHVQIVNENYSFVCGGVAVSTYETEEKIARKQTVRSPE